MDADILTKLGAIYGAVQGVAQIVMMFAPKHTIAFRWAKALVSGPPREVP